MTAGNSTKPQANVPTQLVKTQPTAEQIRYAKLAQFSEHEIGALQEKIKEVRVVTCKSTDVVSVALHECNYDVNQAIQNILDGNYDFSDNEWQTKPSKKRKPQGTVPASTAEKNSQEDDVIENHVNEEEDEKSSSKPSKPTRGLKKGRTRKPDEKPDEKPAEWGKMKDKENTREEAGDRGRSFDRGGRGRSRGKGRGGAQRGGMRRGGFGRGGSAFGPGKGSQRGRGRGFGRRSKQDKDAKTNFSEVERENSIDKGSNEKESWDFDDGNDVGKESTNWAFMVEAEDKNADWSDNQWGSENNTASLFARSMMPPSSQSENWSHANGPDSSWGTTSPNRQQPGEEAIYRPENVDTAVIKSQRADPSSKQESYTTSEQLNRPTYTANLHSNQFVSKHPTSSIASSILGANYSLQALAKASVNVGTSEVNERPTKTTIISGVHDSYTLEQEHLQPVKVQRQPKPKKTSRPPVPSQPVEMPKSFTEEIEQQLGGLEFGSGPSISPKFGSESSASFGPSATAVTTEFQKSSPQNISSTVHAESVRHSVAVPESTANLSNVATIQSTISTNSDRPKTPPGLKSLQDHQSPGRGFASPSSRDINRIAPRSDSIGFPRVSRSSVQNLIASTSVNATDEALQPALDSSYTSARSVMNHDISEQNAIVSHVKSDQRGLPSQAMMGLGTASLQNHLQHKQSNNAFSTVSDSYVDQSLQSKAAESLQSGVSASFSVSNASVPGGSSQVTYTSAPLASHVLGYQSNTTITSTQTTARTQVTTSKIAVSAHHGMMPMNMFPGMQQGIVLPPYTTYSYGDMVVPRMPMANYFDMVYQSPAQSRESPGPSFQGGDSKFGRDASSPVASSINTGNIHAAHAQQFLSAAATPMAPYGYAYYSPNVLQGSFPVFTAPPTQMQTGKGSMVGTHYHSGYTSPHNSHAYNSGASQEFGKGAYHQTASQSLQHSKSNQGKGSLGGGSLSADSSHHAGYKSQFSQDTKGYQLTPTPPSLGIQIPHAQNHMTNYTPYMMQHHTQLMPQTAGHLGHQQLDGPVQSMAASQQQKREAKGQNFRSTSIWSATN